MGIVYRAGKQKKEGRTRKEKGEGQIRKEKRERQTETKVPIALAGLKMTKTRFEGLEKAETRAEKLKEVVTGVEKLEKAVMAGPRGPTTLLPPALLLPAFLSLLASSASTQAVFLAFDKRFLRIFSLFSYLFFSQGSSALSLLSSVLAIASSISLLSPQSKL